MHKPSASIALLLTLSACFAPVASAQSAKELAPKVRQILDHYCAQCHQADLNFPDRKIARFDFVLDLERLASEYVYPGKPEESLLYKQIKNDKMPSLADFGLTPGLTDEEKRIIFKWIEALPAR